MRLKALAVARLRYLFPTHAGKNFLTAFQLMFLLRSCPSRQPPLPLSPSPTIRSRNRQPPASVRPHPSPADPRPQADHLYGKELAETLQQRPSAEILYGVTRRFGTINVALILARITRGLGIAVGLETRLANRAARREQFPQRSPATIRAASPRKPHAARPPRGSQDGENPNDRDQDDPAALLAALPTAEEIAA